MTHEPSNPNRPPAPELLSALADGELAEAERSHVEAWLAARPEARAEVAAWQRLDRDWQAAVPPEPTAEAWEKVRAAIAAGLDAPRRRSPVGAALTAVAAVAAAVVALVWSGSRPPAEELVYPVAAPQDVVILSIDPRDEGALVVGQAPSVEPIVLATADDVTLVKVEPYAGDGVVPDMWSGRGTAPMIVPPAGDR
jgi:anti-sigma factor RsiW